MDFETTVTNASASEGLTYKKLLEVKRQLERQLAMPEDFFGDKEPDRTMAEIRIKPGFQPVPWRTWWHIGVTTACDVDFDTRPLAECRRQIERFHRDFYRL